MASPEEPVQPRPGDPSDGEDLTFEIAFFEEILQRLPDSIDVLMALGSDYTRRGQFERGLTVDQRLCKLRERDPVVHYNLACSCSLLGRVDEAFLALEQAIALGYHDFTHMQRDPDLTNLRQAPRYVALLEQVLRKHVTS